MKPWEVEEGGGEGITMKVPTEVLSASESRSILMYGGLSIMKSSSGKNALKSVSDMTERTHSFADEHVTISPLVRYFITSLSLSI